MARAFARKAQGRCQKVWQVPLLALSWLGASLAGCNNTCFSITSNPPTGTITIKAGDPKPSCTLTVANGLVRVVTEAPSPCSSCLGSHQPQHIFLSLRGIAVHSSAVADDASPEWQELMPQLLTQPLQVDLMSGAAGLAGRQPLGEGAAIPAGAYHQLRLRFVPNQPARGDALPERNACHGAGFNCVVWEDGRIQPLLLDSVAPELRIPREQMAGGSLLVLPDATADLVLDVRVSWALSSSAGQGVQFFPSLTSTAFLDPQSTE